MFTALKNEIRYIIEGTDKKKIAKWFETVGINSQLYFLYSLTFLVFTIPFDATIYYLISIFDPNNVGTGLTIIISGSFIIAAGIYYPLAWTTKLKNAALNGKKSLSTKLEKL